MRLTGSKLTGSNAHAYLGFYDDGNVVTSGNLAAGNLYFILKKANGNDELPPEGSFFRAASTVNIAAGDRYLRLDYEQLYKTSAEFTMEQGVVEIGDDQDPSAKMLDGIVNISGSISGMFRYREDDGSFDDVTVDVMNTFMDAVEQDGTRFTYIPRNDARVFLLILMNATAKEEQDENWLYVPIIISSLGMNFDNTDAQTRDISWTKGEGKAIRYAIRKRAG